LSQCCGKVPTPDDVEAIRESIESSIEWEVVFDPPADSIEIELKEADGFDRITAHYDEKGYLHIVKVYTEEVTVNGITHEKGEKHETLSFKDQRYRVSQDFDPSGKPIPGTAHISDQTTHTVVWRESK